MRLDERKRTHARPMRPSSQPTTTTIAYSHTHTHTHTPIESCKYANIVLHKSWNWNFTLSNQPTTNSHVLEHELEQTFTVHKYTRALEKREKIFSQKCSHSKYGTTNFSIESYYVDANNFKPNAFISLLFHEQRQSKLTLLSTLPVTVANGKHTYTHTRYNVLSIWTVTETHKRVMVRWARTNSNRRPTWQRLWPNGTQRGRKPWGIIRALIWSVHICV